MLAIVIPYYKFTFFEATLESLASQTDQRFKVYIGDDASLESPSGLLENYKGKFDFDYHRFEENFGGISLTQQWERCIALSGDEEWIMVLGDDDVLGENVVEEFYNLVYSKKQEIDLIRCKLKILRKDNTVRNDDFTYDDYENHDRFLMRIFSLVENISASEFIFRRNLYLKEGGFYDFPLGWFSDYATWLKYSKESGIYNLSSAIVYWRLSDINISSTDDDSKRIILKIKSLFLFLSFLKIDSNIEKKELIYFTNSHLKNLLTEKKLKECFKIFYYCIGTNQNAFKIKLFSNFVYKRIQNRILKTLTIVVLR